MKIVYCLPQIYKPGGIERIVSIKANYLVEHGYDVSLIFANQKNKPSFYPLSNLIKLYDLQVDYDSTLELPILKRILKKQTLKKVHRKRLEKLLFQLKADIVISTFTHEAEFLPSIKDGSKKILEFHFCRKHKKMMADAFHFSFLTRIAYYCKSWIEENVVIPRFDQFVVLTEEDKSLWKNKIKNIISIPNIAPKNVEKLSSLTSNHIIAVGRLDAQKGFDRLINNWKYIIEDNQDWVLDIYGSGPDEALLRKQILELGLEKSVIIHSPSLNIYEKYKESSILLMTSRYEGWGLVLSEAMSYGLPVIAYGCKCGPKDIITDSMDGFCINDGDAHNFIEKTKLLMNNRDMRRKFGNAASKNIQRYSLHEVMNKWDELFNEIIRV